MAIAYLGSTLFIIFSHLDQLTNSLSLIFTHAFNGTAATGGFAGATLSAAIRFGIARGVFSNEAGLGSSPIAHAAAKTNNPVQQGLIAMLGTFIDTLVICTLTALVIIMTGAWESGANGAVLTTLAFNIGLPGLGGTIVAIGLSVFAFTTLLGWSYYGECCAVFIFGVRAIVPYRLLWLLAIPMGATGQLTFIWLLADIMNALMALPNLIALILLSPFVFKYTRAYFTAK
jgi:AGCS family alanine or glycine:cation symporter